MSAIVLVFVKFVIIEFFTVLRYFRDVFSIHSWLHYLYVV